jgi:hypothetical protein
MEMEISIKIEEMELLIFPRGMIFPKAKLVIIL